MNSSGTGDLEPPTASLRAGTGAAAPSASPDGRPPPLRVARCPPRGAPPAYGRSSPSRVSGTPDDVSLLDLDADLGRGIEPQDWESARHATRAKPVGLDPGAWPLPTNHPDTGNIIGLIVSDGMISRETALSEHVAFELLTPGDVLLLPATDDLALDGAISLSALSPTRLIVLGKPFIHAAARWPSLLTNLHRRVDAQRQRLAIQGLAAHLPRAEDRLLLTLWLLADRCGRVTPDGTVLPLSLSHETLARLAAARRPTITLALRALETAERIQRRPNGHLTLTPAARRRVHRLTNATINTPPLGPNIALGPLNPATRRSSIAQHTNGAPNSAQRNGRVLAQRQ